MGTKITEILLYINSKMDLYEKVLAYWIVTYMTMLLFGL